MIQRKQTLFLLGAAILPIFLLFVPNTFVQIDKKITYLYLIPLQTSDFIITDGHRAAIISNFLLMSLSFVTVFLFKIRSLQVKLCYIIIVLAVVQALMCQFCPFLEVNLTMSMVSRTWVGMPLSLSIALFGFLAQYFIKKDIELLKSADRIR